MSRSNYDKPFYVDVGTSIVAIRCASNHDVIQRWDHGIHGMTVIKIAEETCDRMNQEAEKLMQVGNAAAMREALKRIRETAKAWADPGADAAVTLGLIIDKADIALAAPPRNCDIYANVDDAEAAWMDMCKARKGGPSACRDCHSHNLRGGCNLPVWLFATAEGGAHG